MLDETVDAVNEESLRLQSESRQVASHSLRTCMTQIVATVSTQFIPGKWKDRPKDDMLKSGALELMRLAEDYWGCEVRPIDPRYLINFDDTGRHHLSAAWTNRKGNKRHRVSKKGTNQKSRGTRSINRKAEWYDVKINGINSKLKVVINAAGKMGPIVIHFPIFSKEELSVPFVVIPVPGLTVGGDVDPSSNQVGYVILSRKGGKSENDGVSPSELVTEWYYTNIVQKFIVDIRESDTSAKWTQGSSVSHNFRSTTKLDGEKSMMSLLKKKEIEKKDQDIGNIVFKIAAAATGCYQPLDLATLFKLLNEKLRNLTIDGNNSDLSNKFRDLLTELRDKGIFLSRNQLRIENIIGIVGVCPAAYQETFTRRRIQDCWVTSGDPSHSTAH